MESTTKAWIHGSTFTVFPSLCGSVSCEARSLDVPDSLLCRTMKASVRDELTIPKQTRYLVPIELGRIERHVSVIVASTRQGSENNS